jgi:hypothetical protein
LVEQVVAAQRGFRRIVWRCGLHFLLPHVRPDNLGTIHIFTEGFGTSSI